MSQLDLFAAPPQYPGWKPDPMSAEAYEAFWEAEIMGVTTKRIAAPLFRGSIDPYLARITH